MSSGTFDFDFKERAILNAHVKSFFLNPEFWIDTAKQLSITLIWNRVSFDEINKVSVPKRKGIYAFVLVPNYPNFLETNYLFYVGKTNRTLYKRFQEYINEKQGKGKPRVKIHNMLNQYDGHLYFYFTEIPDESVVDEVEEKLLNVFVPHVNTDIPEAKIHHELKNIYERN